MRGIINHKGLLSVLTVLVVAIIGLSTVIIMNIQTNTQEDEESQSLKLEQEKYLAYVEEVEKITADAEKLVQEGEEGVAAVKEIYSEKIQQLLEERADERDIMEYITGEISILSSAGYKKDALEVMLDFDCGIFESAMDQYVCLSQTYNLAKELNETDIMNDYYNKIVILAERTGVVKLNG